MAHLSPIHDGKKNEQYMDVTWGSWCLTLPATPQFVEQYAQADNKESTKPPNYWIFVKGIHWSLAESVSMTWK